ncbi:MAG: hypothetical protein K2O42_07815 [Oscillospiraceae bacterium]|nr:hypothetical protein [Oscillospiraceae bacterium]
MDFVEKYPQACVEEDIHPVVYCDYALITVEEDLGKYTHFNIGLTQDPYSSAFSNANIYVSGIPGTVNSVENGSHKIAKGYGKMYAGNKLYPNELLYFTTDATSGDSGGPVYTITKYRVNNTQYYDYTALGIMSGDSKYYNLSVKTIPLIQRFYNSNPNYSY